MGTNAIRIAPVLAFALAQSLAAGSRAEGEAPVRVIANEVTYRFASAIEFRLVAEPTAAIHDVVLRYRVGDSQEHLRRTPALERGPAVTAIVAEELVRGQIPPAAVISWSWTIVDAKGVEARTAPREVVYLDERFSWLFTSGDVVRVWYYGDETERALATAKAAREIVADLGTAIGTKPERRIDVVTYSSRDDMQAALASRGEVYESQLTTLGARVASNILVLLDTGDDDEMREILAHELSHLVLHLHFGREYVDAPLWLDEGLAMYTEGPLEPDEAALLDAAIDADEIMSMRSLESFPGRADLVPLAYAESRDIVAYLIDEWGQERFQDLIDAIGETEADTDEILQAIYGTDQLGLYQAYRASRGLGAAATPEPGAARAAPRSTRAPRTPPCGSALLVAPALALWTIGRRRRGVMARRRLPTLVP